MPLSPKRRSKEPREVGLIPLCFRVGVTGHRQLGHEAHVRSVVRSALLRILDFADLPRTPWTPITLTAVSALAEGADRIVARELLAVSTELLGQDGRLEVILPVETSAYEKDFPRTRGEFVELLAIADRVDVVGASATRNDAYLRCGQQIVDRSEVVIAVWDGQAAEGTGGTAEIVSYARTKGVPIVVVSPKVGGSFFEQVGWERRPITAQDLAPLRRDAFDQIDPKRARHRGAH